MAVSVSTDMWTPINVKAYLTITSHFINDDKLMTILLVVEHFFQNKVLAHFHQGSVELSKEKKQVSRSKFIPLMKMHHVYSVYWQHAVIKTGR